MGRILALTGCNSKGRSCCVLCIPYYHSRESLDEGFLNEKMTRSKPTRKRSGRTKQAPSQSTWDERLIRQLIPWQREIVGIVVFLLSVVTLFGLLGLTNSNLLLPWTRLLRQFAGWGAIPLALTAAVIGVFLILRRTERSIHPYPGQVIGVELLLLAALPLSHILFGDGLMGALDGRGGGLVGWALSEPLIDLIGPLLTILLHLSFLLLGLALILRIGWSDVVQWVNNASIRLQIWSNELEVEVAERKAQMAAIGESNRMTLKFRKPD